MNVLVDMNLSPDWAEFLTGAGLVAVHWSNEGPPDATDHVSVGWAAERNYVVLSGSGLCRHLGCGWDGPPKCYHPKR